MLHRSLALSSALALALLAGCRSDEPVTIAELSAVDTEDAGKQLMRQKNGLWRLDQDGQQTTAVVAVHGLASKGKEWIEPLAELDEADVELYFFRWNYRRCPSKGAAKLVEAINQLIASSPHLERVVVVAHSYGGLISALMAQSGGYDVEIDVHIIASPLASTKQMRRLCRFEGVPEQAPAEGVDWHQWRTVKDEDGVYEDMDVDPQLVDLPELEVTELPATDEGQRIGHNRSIAYVVDELQPLLESETAP